MLEEYNKITTPKDLLIFMDKYIQYGLIDDKGKIYTYDMKNFQKACQNKWKLKSGIDIIKSGYGHCFDQVEVERDWFTKHHYKYKTFFIIFELNYKNSYTCHTYLAYQDKKNNTWNWFEHADESNKGIHTYQSLNELIYSQKEKHIEYNKNINLPITKEIINTIHIYEYTPPIINSSNQEFLDNIFEKGIDITSSINKKEKK